MTGQVKVDTLSPISIDDLLGRDEVIADRKLLSSGVEANVVLVTGAGGSIGSELSLQITRLKPKKLILFEINESCLYQIDKKLKKPKT